MPDTPHPTRPCPTRRQRLEERDDGELVLDVCREHGICLDHGELEVQLERAKIDAARDGRAKVNRSTWSGFEKGFAAGTQID